MYEGVIFTNFPDFIYGFAIIFTDLFIFGKKLRHLKGRVKTRGLFKHKCRKSVLKMEK